MRSLYPSLLTIQTGKPRPPRPVLLRVPRACGGRGG